MKSLLDGFGVDAHLRIVLGQEHSFDYAPDPEPKLKELFDAFAARVLSSKIRS